MELYTVSVALLASPFAKELASLTVELVPLIVELGGLIVGFRNSTTTPSTAHQFECQVRDVLERFGRVIVEWTYNRLEPDDFQMMPAQIFWNGEWYRRRKKAANKKVATLFGMITLWRYRYEGLERGVRSIFPLEIGLGIVAGRATPALAERVAWGAASNTQQTMKELLKRDHNVHWSVKTYRQVVSSMSAGLSEHRQEAQVAQVLTWLREAFASSGCHRPVLSVGRDGIFVPLRQQSEYREGATATVSVLDRRGQRLGTVYLGQMPESGQLTLSQHLTALVVGVLTQWDGPVPRLEYVTDAGFFPALYFAKVLKKMEQPRHAGKRLEWIWVVDFYHASGYVNKIAEALFGAGPKAHAWAHKMRRWLRDKPHGIYRVLHSAAALRARTKMTAAATESYQKAYRYLRKRMAFMDYVGYRKQGLAIGSGITEAACKIVFTQRLKQSGMKWSIEGGQAILNLRVLKLSGVWPKVHEKYLATKTTIQVGKRATEKGSHAKTSKKAA